MLFVWNIQNFVVNGKIFADSRHLKKKLKTTNEILHILWQMLHFINNLPRKYINFADLWQNIKIFTLIMEMPNITEYFNQ